MTFYQNIKRLKCIHYNELNNRRQDLICRKEMDQRKKTECLFNLA